MTAFQKPKGPRRICALFFGDSKTGKTRAALSFPKPAVIDYEGEAAAWFADQFEFVCARANTFTEGEALFGDLREAEAKTLVEDSVSAPHYRLMDANAADDGKVKAQAWPQIKLTERAHILRARDCGINYVATAREKAEYYKAGETMKNGKTATGNEFAVKSAVPDFDEDIAHEFDLVIRLFKENGKHYGEITHSRSAKLPQGKVIQDVTYQHLIEILKADRAPDLVKAIESAQRQVGMTSGDLCALTLKLTRGKTNDYREASDDEKQLIFDAIAHHKEPVAP